MQDNTLLTVSTYDKVAKAYSKTYPLSADLKFYKPFLKLTPQKGKLLECGCGDGKIANFFRRNGFSATGIDLSSKMLQLAKKDFPKVNFKKMDMRKLKFPSKSFDALIVPYSLFHIQKKEIQSTLSGFNRILKENGKLLLILQYGRGEGIVSEPLDPYLMVLMNRMNKKEISAALKERGFRVLRFLERKPARFEWKWKKLCVIAQKV